MEFVTLIDIAVECSGYLIDMCGCHRLSGLFSALSDIVIAHDSSTCHRAL